MKTLTIDQFETLLLSCDWTVRQEINPIDSVDIENPHDGTWITNFFGEAKKIAELEGITITYTEGYNYNAEDEDSLKTGTDGQDVIWEIEGAKVVDEDGDEMDQWDLADYLQDFFDPIDYSGLEICSEEEIDLDGSGLSVR